MRNILLRIGFLAATLAFAATANSAPIYFNVFNIEGESGETAAFATYDSLTDMLADQNRTGVFTPDSMGFGHNIVGAGSDGTVYWNVFNFEGNTATPAAFITYDSLTDMLADQNRVATYTTNSTDIVGSGSDGAVYWSVFNNEIGSATSAQFVTYAALTDMLTDQNRTGVFTPNTMNAGHNIVGSGASLFTPGPQPTPVPEPGSLAEILGGIAALAMFRRIAGRRAAAARSCS